jgi:hypothetical protein
MLTKSVIVAGLLCATAQAPTDSSSELLTEVRSLRADLQQVASVGVHAQILIARLSSQEHLLKAVSDQLAEVRQSREDAEHYVATFDDIPKRVEEMLRTMPREQVDQYERHMRAEQVRVRQRAANLRQQESDLLNQLTNEQSRWVDLNAQLEELVRQLPASKP